MRYGTLFAGLLLAVNVQASGLRSLGDLEAMNDIGLGDVRETIKAYDRTLTVFGQRSQPNGTARINRGYGNARKFYDRNTNRQIQVQDVPTVTRDANDLLRYLER